MQKIILYCMLINSSLIASMAKDISLSIADIQTSYEQKCKHNIYFSSTVTINCGLTINMFPQKIEENLTIIEDKLTNITSVIFKLNYEQNKYAKNISKLSEINNLVNDNTKEIKHLEKLSQSITEKLLLKKNKLILLKSEVNVLKNKNNTFDKMLQSIITEVNQLEIDREEDKKILDTLIVQTTTNFEKINGLDFRIVSISTKVEEMKEDIHLLLTKININKKSISWFKDRLFDVNRDFPRIGILKGLHDSSSAIDNGVQVFSISLEGRQVGHSVSFSKFSFSENPKSYSMEMGLIYFWYEDNEAIVFNPYFGTSTGVQWGGETVLIGKIFTGLEYKKKLSIEYGRYNLHKKMFEKRDSYHSSKFVALKYAWSF